ncbi:TonB-dependent receptor [Spirosoma sp. HMF4905]|uniref:TonB-dependent receptor n=1 Tax=Spirosoma arboris TaxID=2682092 RepID=A0A7K1SI70_9BACT|nr:TonB-dependent receptor [Spirosoma arboris]MVM33463.1 TonB-dependent receptor [Spirosoma arboris]
MNRQLSSNNLMANFFSFSEIDLLVFGLIVLFNVSLAVSAAYAQPLSRPSVVGSVRDAAGKPVEFATVLLLKTGDSAPATSSVTSQSASAAKLVKGAVGDAHGRYVFDNIGPGTYQVAAQMVGYQKTTSALFTVVADQPEVKVPPITLLQSSQTLGEVTVAAKKPFIEQLPDKTVINVENSIVSAGGTALEVLEKAPGILVDNQNDRITLKGREGTLIMIDGKPTYLSAQEVVNLLRNTPSNGVESIELITNPSARYDAAGNAGIINIRLKRGSRKSGTNGSSTLGAGYGRFPKASAGLTLNHRAGGLNVFGNYNYDYRESFGSVDALRKFGSGDSLTTVNNLGYRPSTAQNHTFKVGADYALSKRTSIGVMANGLISNNQATIDNKNLVYDAKGQLEQTVTMINVSTRGTNRLATNVNFKHTFDTLGRELTVDADYSRVTIQPQDNMRTRYLGTGGEETQPELIQRNRPPSTVTIRAAKADYVHPLHQGGRLEAGGKISYVTSDNDVRFETLTENGYVADPQRTNHFLYDETITAGYLNANRDWGKWSVQAGIRAEHTRSLENSVTLSKVIDRNYLNLFPSAFLTYKANQDHQWRASYSRRIDRPNYQDLNPFVYVMDPYTYNQGNPFLRPQYTNAFQVSYTYRNETNISLSYNHTTDVITGVNEQQERVMRVTTVNLAALDNINLSVSLPLKPTNWWNLQPSANVFWNAYNAEFAGQRLDYRQLSANLTLNQSFILPYGLTAELSGFYNSPSVYGMMHFRGMGQLSVGLQKSLWDKAATLRLNVSDILHTMRSGGTLNFASTNLSFISQWESRVARLTFTYNFGNRNLKTARQRRSGVEDEQNRIGGGNN